MIFKGYDKRAEAITFLKDQNSYDSFKVLENK